MGLGLLVVAAAWAAGRLVGLDVDATAPELPHPHGPRLPLPDPGEVLPALLADGFPVFVVRHEDGTTDVFGAVSPHQPAGGAQKALAWCSTSRWFEDLQHGSKFSEWGAYVGGPAPTGLVRYPSRRAGDEVIMDGDAEPALPRGAGRRAEPSGPGCGDGGAHEPVVHARGDQSFPSPWALADSPEDRWRPAQAAVESIDGSILICAVSEVVGGSCPQTALRVEPGDPVGVGGPHLVTGAVLLWIAEDEVKRPILLAETTR